MRDNEHFKLRAVDLRQARKACKYGTSIPKTEYQCLPETSWLMSSVYPSAALCGASSLRVRVSH